MKQLVEDIAKALVDIPEAVSVRVVEGEQATVLSTAWAWAFLGPNVPIMWHRLPHQRFGRSRQVDGTPQTFDLPGFRV